MENDQDSAVSTILDRALSNAAQSLYDDYVKANASFRSNAGLKAKIVRTLHGKGCKWCRNLAGTYSYPDVPKDVYRRHDNCSCTVTYVTEKGTQDVHSKKWETKKIDTNSNDNMGKKKPRVLYIGNKTYDISTYKNDLYTNIYCQTNSKNSRKICAYLNEKINSSKAYGDIKEIVVVKNKILHGISAYDHVTNTFYISEELIDESSFKKLVDTNYFAAHNLDDVIEHELGGHKAHWDAIYRYQKENDLVSLKQAKEDIEKDLREYIKTQINNDQLYIYKTVSENAFDEFNDEKTSLFSR